MAKLFANSGDPDQTPRSDLGLHCLPSTIIGVYRLQWVNEVTQTMPKKEVEVKNKY